jgi:hypothetical protein
VGRSHRHHVVAKGYLRGFADDDGMLVRAGTDRLVPTSHAAVKPGAYLVTLRDGTRTDSVEQALNRIETMAIPLLRRLEAAWPLDRPERAVLLEYLAAQMVRTPDAMRRHARLVDAAAGGAPPGRDALRMRAMIEIKNRLMTLISAMQWTLVGFRTPVLTTSDHPVAPVPIDLRQTTSDFGVDVDNIGELWFPVAPTLLLVCCWRDLPDAPRLRSGRRRIAESVNAAMRDQAEAGWYWRPGTDPPVSERISVVGELLYAGYGPAAIRRSTHRRLALREVAAHRGDLPNTATVFHASAGAQPPR